LFQRGGGTSHTVAFHEGSRWHPVIVESWHHSPGTAIGVYGVLFIDVLLFILLDGGSLMSVQPTTSFVLTQPTQPPPGSLVLTHQPGLVLSQQVAAEPPDTIVLGHHGASVPGSFVLTQPAPQPGAIVLSQPSAAPIGPFVPPQLMLPAGTEIAMESRQGSASEGMTTLNEFQAGPVFSQAGRGPKIEGETRTSDVPVYHIPSGSQLTVLQPPPGQQESVRLHSAVHLLLTCAVSVFTCALTVSAFVYSDMVSIFACSLGTCHCMFTRCVCTFSRCVFTCVVAVSVFECTLTVSVFTCTLSLSILVCAFTAILYTCTMRMCLLKCSLHYIDLHVLYTLFVCILWSHTVKLYECTVMGFVYRSCVTLPAFTCTLFVYLYVHL